MALIVKSFAHFGSLPANFQKYIPCFDSLADSWGLFYSRLLRASMLLLVTHQSLSGSFLLQKWGYLDKGQRHSTLLQQSGSSKSVGK